MSAVAGPDSLSFARRVGALIDDSPSPYHAVETARTVLEADGFEELAPGATPAHGRQYLCRGGALVAWVISEHHSATSGFRIVGAHTDSPNLRIKPQPDSGSGAWSQLGVEIYGGALLNSWLDRDLGLSGRVAVRHGDGVAMRLVRDDRPLLRVPQLAIHLDREINDKGLLLNRQRHLAPIWAAGAAAPEFRTYLAEQLDVAAPDVVAWDMMAHDLTPARLTGLDEQFLASARLDNLLSCFVALDALRDIADAPGSHIPVVCLFDHEEVGSVSTTGAASPLLSDVLDRVAAGFEADAGARAVSRSVSLLVSADGAHATHPNYPERHEPDHPDRGSTPGRY